MSEVRPEVVAAAVAWTAGRDVAAAAVRASCSALIRAYRDERRRPRNDRPPGDSSTENLKKQNAKTKRGTQTDLQDAAVHVCHGTRTVTEHCGGWGGLAS